VILTIFDNLI